jgi:GNAT superfamily N-acetyltransferase
MHSEIQIRQAELSDAAAVAKILYDSFMEFEPLYTRSGFEATTPPAEQVLVRMQEGPVWLALRESAVLGTVAAVSQGESVYMRGMAVLSAARRLGVGARLLETVEHWAEKQGTCRIYLTTTPFLHAAIRMYEKHGFKRMPTGPQDLFGTPLFAMEKKISKYK